MSVTIEVGDAEIRAIRAEQQQAGGFQDLFERLERGLEGHTLTVDEETAREAVRRRGDYGVGLWQISLEHLADKLAEALDEEPFGE